MAVSVPRNVTATPDPSREGRIAVSWDPVAGADGYDVRYNRTDYRTAGTPYKEESVSGTGYTFNLRQPYGQTRGSGTAILFQVRAKKGAEISAWSFPVYATAPTLRDLPVPRNFRVVASRTQSNRIIVSWSSVRGATRYQIAYRRQGEISINPWRRITVNGGSSARWVSPALSEDHIYIFTMRAEGQGRFHSEWTEQDDIRPILVSGSLGAPDNFQATPSSTTNGRIDLSWDAVDGASAYEVSWRRTRSAPPGGREWDRIRSVSGTSLPVLSLVQGQLYYFQVRATASGRKGARSHLVTARAPGQTALAIPTNFIARSHPSRVGFARLHWSPVSGATGYRLESRLPDGSSRRQQTISGGSTSSFDFQGIPGRQYFFRLQAIGPRGAESGWTPFGVSSAPRPHPRTSAPANLTATPSETFPNQIDLSWDEVSDAASYIWMYRESPNGNYTETSVPAGTLMAVLTGEDVIPGKTYYFNIVAVSQEGVRSNRPGPDISAVVGVPAKPPPPATLTVTRTTDGDVRLEWDEVPEATHYEWSYRLLAGPDWIDYTETDNTSIVVQGLTEGQTYCFTVRSENGSEEIGDWITFDAMAHCILVGPLVLPLAPTGVAAVPSPSVENQIDLTWDIEINSERYTWGWRENGTMTWMDSTLDDMVGPPVFFEGTAGTAYDFHVRGENVIGEGPFSEVLNVTAGAPAAPGVPANLTASPHAFVTGRIDLSWDPVPDAVSYTWAYRTGAADWSWITTVFTEAVFQGGAAGISYVFTVRANTEAGFSDWAPEITAVTAQGTVPGAPTNFSVTESASIPGQILLAWDPVEGADEYEWQWRPTTSEIWVANRVVGNAAVFSGSPDTLYHFALRCVTNGVASTDFAYRNLQTRAAVAGPEVGIAGGEFVNRRLPEDIERGAQGGPRYSTSIATTLSGRERRIQNWSQSRLRWEVGYGVQGSGGFARLVSFFHEMRGRARGFRFKDWSDYRVEGFREDGTTVGDAAYIQEGNLYYLAKQYGDPVEGTAYIRKITHPTETTVSVQGGGTLRLDGMDGHILDPLTQLTFDAEGRITTPPWQGEFDVPVRFDTDEIEVDLIYDGTGSIPEFPIVELRI